MFCGAIGLGTYPDYERLMAYFIKPLEEERCVLLSYDGEMPPRDIAAARYEAHGVLNARRWSRMMVDLTRLRFVPTSAQLFDFAKGFAGQVPPDARVALVVHPEQVRDANLVEKVARKDGVFLSYFVDPGKAALWMQRSQPLRRNLARGPLVEESNASKPIRLSTQAQDPELRAPHHHCNFFDRRCAAASDITGGARPVAIAET
ncbi:MAG TPA: hypothetical protein VJA21_02785 [Verrucomicrobiae bacterium]